MQPRWSCSIHTASLARGCANSARRRCPGWRKPAKISAIRSMTCPKCSLPTQTSSTPTRNASKRSFNIYIAFVISLFVCCRWKILNFLQKKKFRLKLKHVACYFLLKRGLQRFIKTTLTSFRLFINYWQTFKNTI